MVEPDDICSSRTLALETEVERERGGWREHTHAHVAAQQQKTCERKPESLDQTPVQLETLEEASTTQMPTAE